MKSNQSRLIILVIILLVVLVGGWYYISQSSATSETVATTPETATTTPATGGKVTTTNPVSTTHTTPPAQGTVAVPPQIIEFDPAAGSPGTQVTITGTNFSHTTNYISFGSWGGRYRADGTPDNQIAVVASADGSHIIFTVPTTGSSGRLCNPQDQCIEVTAAAIGPGTYPITVKTAGGVSNIKDLTVVK